MMKILINRLFCTILFLFFTISVIAQYQHEVKLDLLKALDNEYIVHYEVLFTKNIGFEASFGVERGRTFIHDFNNSNSQFSFSTTELNLYLAGKFYISGKKKYGRGFYFGPYLNINYLLDREDGYVEKYEEINNRPPSIRFSDESRFDTINLGGQIGYKWLILSRFVLEAQISFANRIFIGPGITKNFGNYYTGEGFVKLGYRFNNDMKAN